MRVPFLFRLLHPYWPHLLLTVAFALLPALAQALLPVWLVKPLFDEVLAQGRFGELPRLLGLGLGLFGVLAVGGYLQEACVGYLSVRLPKELRERLLEHLLRVDLAQLKASPAALSGRILADLRELESFIFFGLSTVLIQGLTLLALLGQMLWRYGELTLYLLLCLPVLGLLLGWVGRRVTLQSERTQQAAERLAGGMAEGFGRLELIRALGLEDFARSRFAQHSRRHFAMGLQRVLTGSLYLPLSQLATGAIVVLLLFLGVGQVEAGKLSLGDLTAYLTLLALTITPLQTLSRGWMLLSQAEGAAGRVMGLLRLRGAIPAGSLSPEGLEGRLELRQVWFAYGDEAVLSGLDLSLEPGTLTALVGPSGAGKSTVLRLLLGLYRPDSGQVLLDGRPLQAYAPAFLRAQVAWVPQEPLLFGGTVQENLEALAPGASPQAMATVLRQVYLLDELPRGLASELSEEGGGLSVGQRQRLALAAALLRGARILLLDEPTSALDPRGEARVLEALEAVRPGRTVLVVAHRLSTVQAADKIAVLQGGRVVEQGRHAELLSCGGLYAQLWRQGGGRV
ncbi:ABC transporter ATP-binding protein [Calidithermus timidus]|jgi:ABC-type multidrug transport system fused ATPase/permease subunit|uniref:ABC transporter ATP-binding protein n=1 Tax=Calidithermus timidus TaxID=307124 RepID=UPI00037A3190|nr:ABC transporter ATP-binding protein [Calidithermus timidus]